MQRKEQTLITRINDWVTTNNNKEITGALMNDLLVDIVESSHLSNGSKWQNSAAALRGYTLYKNLDQVGLLDTLDFYTFNSSSNATDDGVNVIKPTEIATGSPGRWLLQRNFLASPIFEKEDLGSGLEGIKPVASNIKRFSIEENSYGLTSFKITNTNDVDNYVGAVLELKGSGPDFENAFYIGKYGASYWIPSWADSAGILTDKNLVISSLGVSSEILFQIGGGFNAPEDAIKIKANKVLTSVVTDYETLITEDNDFITKKYFDLNSSSGASWTYTNSSPMPSALGGYQAGTTFNNQNMQQMWDGLLYPYQHPDFNNFTIIGESQTLEVGEAVQGGLKTFTWSTSNTGNVEINSIEIRDITAGDVVLGTGLANDGIEELDIGNAITKTTNTSHQWRIYGDNTNGTSFNRSFSINWYWRLYFGESAGAVLPEASLKALRVSMLTNSVSRDYQFMTGGYKNIAHVSALGTLTSFVDVNTGFAVPFEAPYTVSVTNDHGVTVDYKVYRSTYQLGGSILINAS